MAVRSFRDLEVWQVAHELTLAVYRVTATFPKQEIFGPTSQVRRCVASVPANIAEGWGRRSTKDYLHHLAIANGSLEESKYFLLLARDLAYLSNEDHDEVELLAQRIASMIHGLEGALKKRMATQTGAVDRVEPTEIPAPSEPSLRRTQQPDSRNPQTANRIPVAQAQSPKPGIRSPIPATRSPQPE